MTETKIVSVNEYNRQDMARYREAVEKWRHERSNNIIPQVAFRGFRRKNGELKTTGYVAYCLNEDGTENFAVWRKTKREVESACIPF